VLAILLLVMQQEQIFLLVHVIPSLDMKQEDAQPLVVRTYSWDLVQEEVI
jgi:hypothetical protein